VVKIKHEDVGLQVQNIFAVLGHKLIIPARFRVLTIEKTLHPEVCNFVTII
jgi:hypothetical protein